MKKLPESSAPCRPDTVAENRASFEAIAELFRVFGDATRLQILQALMAGEKNVGQLVEELEMTQANVSKHLKTLHEAKIVSREKRGTATFYQIDDDFIHPLCNLICDKLNRNYRQPEPTFSFSI
ncbi:MAG: metalloregulator ArsR/SmtB family transcription factor [Verrucomicrobiales bacterium]|nr:metalloregulator ArsR/SmtB family transcription factor [Verrucomicrobiales bacterium]